MAIGDACPCPCGTTEICEFTIIARKWQFSVSGITNLNCMDAADYNGFWNLVYHDETTGFAWYDDPYKAMITCYSVTDFWHWAMLCNFTDTPPDMFLRMFPNIRTTNSFCGVPNPDSIDFWSIPVANFNPVGMNVLEHTTVDRRGCGAFDATSVGAITITPVFG